MNAQLKERPLDPPELPAHEWDDLTTDEKRELLEITLDANPKLIECFRNEALSEGIDPFDYWTEL